MMEPYFQDEYTTLYCGKAEDIIPYFKPKSIDLIVTDPPYQYEGKGEGFFGSWLKSYNSKHSPRKHIEELRNINCLSFNPLEFLPLLERPMKKFYGYFFCNKDLVDIYIQYARKNNMMFDILVMAKNNPIPACNSHHLRDLEYVVMIRQRSTAYYHSSNFDDNRKFYMVNVGGESYHPAEKPIGFLMRMISVSSLLGEVVLDPFAGSGSTLLAARELGRKSIGIETEEKFCKITVQRLAQIRLPIANTPPETKQLEFSGVLTNILSK
mgnify:CR=1 FL=1